MYFKIKLNCTNLPKFVRIHSNQNVNEVFGQMKTDLIFATTGSVFVLQISTSATLFLLSGSFSKCYWESRNTMTLTTELSHRRKYRLKAIKTYA